MPMLNNTDHSNLEIGRSTVATLVLLSLCPHLIAEDESDRRSQGLQESEIDEVRVVGRRSQQIGYAAAASEGQVGGEDLSIRPLLQVAELMEAVPGMVAVQHSGSGKANQYFMRGFNLDHGTDFTNYIDDTPINLRSHGHGQGYLDVNGLIPETIERIEYRKGTYRADTGDFSMAGSSRMITIDRFDRPFFTIEAGDDNWQRLAAGGTRKLAEGTFTAVAQYKMFDGPWQRNENLHHHSLWAKYNTETPAGTLTLSLSGYKATWDPTEQIPELAIGTPLCRDEFCAIDTTATGETDRWIATGQLLGQDWRATLYAQAYDWRMSSDPTFAEQINQFDKRTVFGGRLERDYILGETLDALIGFEFRYDDVSRIGVEFYDQGHFVADNGDNEIEEGSVAAYGELVWQPIDKLRMMAGLRADYYNFDVTARNDISAEGSESDNRISPKLSVAYGLTDNIEAYANWGFGFHSNDARGVVDDVNPVSGLVRGEGYEAGVRYQREFFNISLTRWYLDIASELSFVGDSNSVEPKGGSHRHGWEVVGFWQPVTWLAIDAVYAVSEARFDDPAAEGGKYVDGSVEDSGQIGLTIKYGDWDVSSRLRYLGEYALVPDNSRRASELTTLNFRIARSFRRLTLYGELINATDEDGKDIVYFYEHALPELSALSDEGFYSRQSQPRTYRLGIRYKF